MQYGFFLEVKVKVVIPMCEEAEAGRKMPAKSPVGFFSPRFSHQSPVLLGEELRARLRSPPRLRHVKAPSAPPVSAAPDLMCRA